MSFLQPILLAALPVIALPILIHLINQRRYQTIRWGAMMFLLAANRMSRGYARLRQWLILLFRMLALAGLIFAISRPLASGWVGLAAGGRADTTMVLLDRSPSMQEQRQGVAGSKLETGRQQLVRTLNTLSSARWVLIDSLTNTPRELESPDELLRLPAAEPASASADLPAMLQAASDYIASNKPGRTEIWLCSDLRQNDWRAEDGRWQALRDSFVESTQGVRFHLLAYPESAPDNVSVRVTELRRRETDDSAELLVSLRLEREIADPGAADGAGAAGNAAGASAGERRASIPVQFEIEGARSEVTIEMVGSRFELEDHRIPLDRNRERGWGKVSVPADANPADNDFYFVFDRAATRLAVVVSEDPPAVRPLQLSASISPDPSQPCSVETISVEQMPTIDWEKVSLLFWHAALPTGDRAKVVQSLVDRGGVVIFLPPRDPSSDEFAGVRWLTWTESVDGLQIATWRGDQDLLAHTQSGAALPVGQLEILRHCGLSGEHTPLAVLEGGPPLLSRATSPRGGIYFLATTPSPSDSSFAENGVVLYVLVQRALAAGSVLMGSTRQLVAGEAAASGGVRPESWRQLAGGTDAISTEYAFHAGVYGDADRLFAVNRAGPEDESAVLPDPRVADLFRGLDFARVDDQAGNLASLIEEIWRPFVAAMIAALLIEAILCMPRPAARPAADGSRPLAETSRASTGEAART